jgi:hypothetical protein
MWQCSCRCLEGIASAAGSRKLALMAGIRNEAVIAQ